MVLPVRSAAEEWQHSIEQELKMAWIALKTLGLLPFSVKQPPDFGGQRWFINAFQAAYAAGVYIGFGYYAYIKATEIQIAHQKNEFRMVHALMNSTLLVTHLLISPLQWIRMRSVLQFLKDWNAFQECFLRVTCHPLRLGMFWLSSAAIFFTLAWCVGGCFLLTHLVFKDDYIGSLYYLYAAVQLYILLALWVLLCFTSAKAADQLTKRLKTEIANTGVTRGDIVIRYQSAWLRLSQLTRDIGDVFCHVFNVIVIYWLTEMLLTAFVGAKILVNDCAVSKLIGIGGLAINSFLSILIFSLAGNCATNSVSRKFEKSLAELEVKSYDLQKQLHEFAQAVSTHGAVINLGGFYVVDRSLVVSIMSAFATFIVVLLQSSPDEDTDFC